MHPKNATGPASEQEMNGFDDSLFDEFREFEPDEKPCECGDNFIRWIYDIPTCSQCGVMDIHSQRFQTSYAYVRHSKLTKFVPYKRIIYFKQKLKLMTGQKQCLHTNYNSVIETLRNEQFENIGELKKVMKRLNLSKFYKYAYSIFYEIKRIKICKLTFMDVDTIANDFHLFNLFYKKKYKNKYMFSYNEIIYLLLTKRGYDTSYIVRPKRLKMIHNIFSEFINA